MNQVVDNIDKDSLDCMPGAFISLIPIIVLIAMLSVSILLFGSDSLSGGSQMSLLAASGICVCLSMWRYGVSWKKFEKSIQRTIGESSISILVLLIIGMLSGTWMISGVVPTMIYYGVQIMSPDLFLLSTCIICSIVSIMTGSSWTTIATIGVALLGIGEALGVPLPWIAGAIISGSYFGDKMSPLSDTTILASSSSGTDLFIHIRYMLYTTIPTLFITLLIFLFAGFFFSGVSDVHVDEYTKALDSKFNISLLVLIVPIVTAVMIGRRIPALITLFVSSLVAGIMALFLQRNVLLEISGEETTTVFAVVKGLMISFFGSTGVQTGNESVDNLVSTGGMAGMMDTVWLILCAMCFGATMIASRMLQSLTNTVLSWVKSVVGLVSSTVFTGLMLNFTTGDQYISIILTANMFKKAYNDKGCEARLLSRTTEDAVTVTSVLIPWNTCGLTQSTVLGVPTLSYLPYCFFNYLSPLMTIFVAAIKWKLRRKSEKACREDVVE